MGKTVFLKVLKIIELFKHCKLLHTIDLLVKAFEQRCTVLREHCFVAPKHSKLFLESIFQSQFLSNDI